MDLLGRIFFLLSEFAIALLDNGQLDTLLSRKGDERLGLGFSEDEDVGGTGGKSVTDGVLEMDDIETSDVFFLVFDDTDATQVAPASDRGQDPGFEFHEFFDLVVDQVEFNRVSCLDQRVGVANGSSVVRDEVRNPTLSDFNSLDF